MEYYRSFNTEALELSRKLPEEQSELYKRHYVPMPLEEFSEKMEEANSDGTEEKEIAILEKEIAEKLGVKFDAVIGPAFYRINSALMKIVKLEDLTEEHIRNKLYSSKEDKQVAFIHAHTKRFVYIDVPDSKTASINILFVNTDVPIAAQVFVKTGSESSLNLFEWYASLSKNKSMLGVLHELTIGKYSKSEINMLHNENENTFVVGFTKGRIRENAELNVNYIYNGGIATRVKNEINASGFAAKSKVIELVIGSGDQKFDINTVVANIDTDTVSDLESKAALMGNAVCMFKGFANVGENASGSRSYVNERGILLDRTAYMNSIPGMSINNANVKATHSSATAPVDADSLFYLMSRGTDEVVARRLLVNGFFAKSLSKINSAIVKAIVSSLIHEKINNRRFGFVPKLDMSGIWMDQSAPQSGDLFEGHYKYRDVK